MKKIFMSLFVLSITTLANASLKDGVYIGTNSKTGGKCKIEISMDGDYLSSTRSEYRLTLHYAGQIRGCKDYDGVKYPRCASGEHVNGKQDRSIYMMLSEKNDILKIYFQDSDFDSTNDRECVEFTLIR